MARSQNTLLAGLVLVLGACLSAQLLAFVGAPAASPSRGSQDRAVALRARGGAVATVEDKYMITDAMIDEFYKETITGSGGLPPPGVIRDLVIKHFLGTFDYKLKSFTRADKYKGPPPMLPGKKDVPPAMELLKEQMKKPAFVTKGGPALDEADKVEDDGKGWVWLAADMTPGGLGLNLYTAVPYGKRPLLVAKQSDVDGMFEKVNWDKVLERIEVTMGGPDVKQR